MMTDEKYSLLLMRDDCRVRRLRVSPLSLRLLTVALVLLPLLAAFGAWAGFSFWQANRELVSRNQLLDRDLKEARVELERLSNLETLLRSSDPEELRVLLGSAALAPPPSGASSSGTVEGNGAGDGLTGAQAASHAPHAPEAAGVPEAASQAVAAAVAGTPSEAHQPLSTGEARVDNLSVRHASGKRLRINFDLTNPDTRKQLGGQILLFVVTGDGRTLPLKLEPEFARFQISRLKKIATTTPLPEGMTPADAQTLMVEVETEGRTLYREQYAIPAPEK